MNKQASVRSVRGATAVDEAPQAESSQNRGRSISRGRSLRSAKESDDCMDVDPPEDLHAERPDAAAGNKTPRERVNRGTRGGAGSDPMEMSPCPATVKGHAASAALATATAPAPASAGGQEEELIALEALRSRLVNPRGFTSGGGQVGEGGVRQRPALSSPAAARGLNGLPMPLRPSLLAAHDELVTMMERVVSEEGSTASELLLGERGTGKTLVRGGEGISWRDRGMVGLGGEEEWEKQDSRGEREDVGLDAGAGGKCRLNLPCL